MTIFRFVIGSYAFKRIAVITILFIPLVYGVNKLFDSLWGKYASIPLLDLNDVYKPPVNYENDKKLNVKLTKNNRLAIESNKIFRISGTNKNYDYYDTTDIQFPQQTYDITNRIFLEYAESGHIDSILLVISKSDKADLYWKQIFLSTVNIEKLNEFSNEPAVFRINENTLVEQPLLNNNDTLISKALNYFETNKEKLNLGDCGVNCATFRDICRKFNLPCRNIGLQGGDADQAGFYNDIGYPLHALCEVYSSKFKKWYVIDPTYGLRFRNKNDTDYLNAVEIGNMFFFHREKYIEQDSVLSTKRIMVGRDYFKYFENIYFDTDVKPSGLVKSFLRIFYKKLGYSAFHYTSILMPLKNGFYYIASKTFVYLCFILIHFNITLTIITRRLLSVKKPKKSNND